MARISRTINPLHFEDLEPHRFEDLVRQLIYDFRPWRQLEATGRSGGDDGFDVRSFEVVADPDEIAAGDDDQAEHADTPAERVWLIQCKREKAITPKKLQGYLDGIPIEERKSLYGIIFAAAADFSKTSRDLFRAWCRDNGITEYRIWGKGELEDLLFQPKFDNLLFAYFGFSLVVRRRSKVTALRARLTVKKKLKKVIDSHSLGPVLIRDIEDDEYPYVKEEEESLHPRKRTNRWRVARIKEMTHDGVWFEYREYYAYVDGEKKEWDMADSCDISGGYYDQWNNKKDDQAERTKVFETWDKFDERHKTRIIVEGFLAYDDLLEVDFIGDDWTSFDVPHLFVRWPPDGGWSPFRISRLSVRSGSVSWIDEEKWKRVAVFQAEHRWDD